MRSLDVSAFQKAAQFYNVYILVRRTNSESIKYINRNGYVAKRLDCKAKTADFSVTIAGRTKQVAGLVVDPTLQGMDRAFKPEKLMDARKEWDKFKSLLAPDALTEEGKPTYTYLPDGKHYAVQLDRNHKHFGCVMFSSNSLLNAGKYIHGDYDLYDIVPVENSKENIVYTEKRHDFPHNRGKRFFDVQHFLNRNMGVPLVLHGSQAKFKSHTNEAIDIFCPDGKVKETNTLKEIQLLYATVFNGREPYSV